MGKESIKLISTLIAYVVIYIALYKFDSWVQERMFGKFHKQYNFHGKTSTGMSFDEACDILGINKKDARKMSKNDLKKAYWAKAKEVHPDKPKGNEETFKNVKNAYDFVYANAA